MTAFTNELLGYPPDARLLIMNADDFGMCQATNEGILQSIREGVVRSCSLMVPCPWALHAMHLLAENPDIPFAVHLTTVSEPVHYRWGPITPTAQVQSLVDEAGYFYNEERIDEFLAQVDLVELEMEFRAQIETPLAAGLTPTHLDSHCGIHTRREEIFDMTTQLADEYGLALRVSNPAFIAKVQENGYACADHDTLDSYRLLSRDKPEIYFKMLRELPPGLTEWAIHPALITSELKAFSDSWDVRAADFAFAIAPETHRIIAEEGIIQLDYRVLQRIWQENTGA